MTVEYFFVFREGLPLVEQNYTRTVGTFDTVLMGGFISAITDFSKTLSSSSSVGVLRIFELGYRKVVLERGNNVLCAAIASSYDPVLGKILTTAIEQFEHMFREVFETKTAFESKDFRSFWRFIPKMFQYEHIRAYFIPSLTDPSLKASDVPLIGNAAKTLSKINGTSTIGEIAADLGMFKDEIFAVMAFLNSGGLIRFRAEIHNTDFFQISPSAIPILLRRKGDYDYILITKSIGEEGYNLLKSLNGYRSVKRIKEKTNLTMNQTRLILTWLILHGYIQKIPETEILFQAIEILVMEGMREAREDKKYEQALKEVQKELESTPNLQIIDFLNFGPDGVRLRNIQEFLHLDTEVSGKELIAQLDLFSSVLIKKLSKNLGKKVSKPFSNTWKFLDLEFGEERMNQLSNLQKTL